MNPEIKSKWVAALRSGKYEQAQTCLNDGKGGYCCLGVLTDIYIKETGNGKWEEVGLVGYSNFINNSEAESAFLSNSVCKWAELSENNPRIGDKFATILNDNYVPFEEIANLIEEYL